MRFESNFNEDAMINRLARNERRRPTDENPVIREAHRKALETLGSDSINPEEFTEVYGEQSVQKDLELVAKLESKFEKNDTTALTAEVLEAIIYEQAELSDWLGHNVTTINTSRFDDIVNGVDLVARFNDKEVDSYLALGVDVTFGKKAIQLKMEKIMKQIEDDTLTSIKYFESDGKKGPLKHIPRVVIGLERNTVNQLAKLWLDAKKQELGKHHARLMLLNQMQTELETFLAFAQRKNSQRSIHSLENALHTIRETIEAQGEDNPDIPEDRVNEAILEQLAIFENR